MGPKPKHGQHVFRKREPMKAKVTIDWQNEEHMHDSFVHTNREL